ncbi:four-carbon acid sugar kinase family protein [soil metagenome]
MIRDQILKFTTEDFLNRPFAEKIKEHCRSTGKKIIVLDDDPTGTQTMTEVAVLTEWTEEILVEELKKEKHIFYILTNSRSFPEDQAKELATELGNNISKASQKTGIKPVLISRSDSTLRGHFPAEVEALAKSIHLEKAPVILNPAFIEGGRFTLDDVHYVREGEKLIAAADTPFAKDAAFGFTKSNLKEWVEEKTNQQIKAEQVYSLSLDDLRNKTTEELSLYLNNLPDSSVCVINSATYEDIERASLAFHESEFQGKKLLYRTAASFVAAYAGIISSYLSPDQLKADTGQTGGLVMVGSYVPKTTSQLEYLLKNSEVEPIELKVDDVLNEKQKVDELIREISKKINSLLQQGKDVVVYTSRTLITDKDKKKSLLIGNKISQELVNLVLGLTVRPAFFIAKGGITSSDLAVKGLGVKRAIIKGQILAGVPVWKLGAEARFPDLFYTVFPGNVGDETSLAKAVNLFNSGNK